jgi:hypothetical protein
VRFSQCRSEGGGPGTGNGKGQFAKMERNRNSAGLASLGIYKVLWSEPPFAAAKLSAVHYPAARCLWKLSNSILENPDAE